MQALTHACTLFCVGNLPSWFPLLLAMTVFCVTGWIGMLSYLEGAWEPRLRRASAAERRPAFSSWPVWLLKGCAVAAAMMFLVTMGVLGALS